MGSTYQFVEAAKGLSARPPLVEVLLEEELELLLEEDELELLLEDELVAPDDELELLLDELLDEELEEVLLEDDPTMPNGAGCPEQVSRETQLWLSSQPQPLWVVRHRGMGAPYQLQYSPVSPPLEELEELLLEDELELELDELLDEELELLLELEELEDELELLLELDELDELLLETPSPVQVGGAMLPSCEP